MNKHLLIKLVAFGLLTGLPFMPSCACQTHEDASSSQGVAKKHKGTGALWNDTEGYFSRNSSVIEEGTKRYVVYDGNATKDVTTASLLLKEGTFDGTAWSYGEAKVLLEADPAGWDQVISSPSLLKGSFKKDGTEYSYLLAYSAHRGDKDIGNQIGLAYSAALEGPYTKLAEPLISYDSATSGDEYGAGAPSLVSYDKKGLVRIFYSYAEANLANERVADADFSDLNAIKIDAGARQIAVGGLHDNADAVILSNADFALSSDAKTLYCARDVYPLSGNKPGHATSIQTAKADVAIVNDIRQSWTVLDTLTGSKTMDPEDENSLGWDELYAPSFVRDGYGYLADGGKAQYVYSTADEPDSESDTAYLFSDTLALWGLTL